MLWTGEGPDAKALEETMASYSNLLQGFLLLSHGSKIGAGTTLSACIHASVKQVIDCSFMLLKESVASYGNLPFLLLQTHIFNTSLLIIYVSNMQETTVKHINFRFLRL